MSKRIVASVVIFNVLMIVAFMFSNLYISDFLHTQIDVQGGYQGNGVYVIPYLEEYGFLVGTSHIVFAENATAINLGPLPTIVPNYPFIVFWIAIMGNLILIALVLRNPSRKSNPQTGEKQ